MTLLTNADTVALLLDLNRNYVRSAQESDVAWYQNNLAEDYVCSYRDGSIIDKAAFLERIRPPASEKNMSADDVQVRFAGELALIHAAFKYQSQEGRWGTGRYTDIYAERATPQGQRWLCVSAHFNCF